MTDLPALYETIGLPDNVLFVAVVAMGYPADGKADDASRGASVFSERRKRRTEVVRWERW